MKQLLTKAIAIALSAGMLMTAEATSVMAKTTNYAKELIGNAAASAEDIIVFSPKDEDLSLMATDNTKEYSILSGSTMTFESVAITDLTVALNNKSKDYAIFYKDGSIKSYLRAANATSLTVPAGGKLIITARENVKCTIADDYFIVNEVNEPAFIKKYLSDRQTYSFTNTSLIPIKLLSNSKDMDYVIHNPDGSLKTQVRNVHFSELEISSGHTIKITSRNDNLEVCALNNYFTAQAQDTPVFQKRLVQAGETYSYTNVSDSPYYILSNGTDRDYVIYDGAGKITEYGRDTYWGTNTRIEVPASSTIKITSRNAGLELCGLTDYFHVKREKKPVFKKIMVAAGDTYSIKNISDSPYYILSNGTDRDYVMYDGAGAITSYERNTHWGSTTRIKIPSSSTIKITSNRSGLELCALYDEFSSQKENTPAFKTINIPAGDSYTITNNGDKAYYLYSNATTRDYVIYDDFGNITDYVRDTYWGTNTRLSVPAGSSVKVTSRDNGLCIWAIYNIFDYEKTDIPALKTVNIPSGETYSFTNNSDKEYYLLSNSTYRDYVIYNTIGAVTQYNWHTYWGNSTRLAIPAGNTVHITPRHAGLEICAVTDIFDYKKENNQVMKTALIPTGESYCFTNHSNSNYKLYRSGNNIDYAVYNPAGEKVLSKTNASPDSIDVQSGYSVYITAPYGVVTCAGLEQAFSMSAQNITNQFTTLQGGKTYEVANLGANDYVLHWETDKTCYDSIVYGFEDTIVSHNFDLLANKDVTIPSGGRAIITPNNTLSLENSNDIRITEYSTPVYQYTQLKDGESYYFTNTTLVDVGLRLADGRYDYITYNKDNTINTYQKNVHLSSLTVPTETSVSITCRYSEKTIASLNGYFTVKKDNTKRLNKKNLVPGDTVRVKNLTEKDYNLLLSGNYFDYVSYNADGSVKTHEHEVNHSQITIPSGAYIELTAIHAMSIDYLNGIFSVTELTTPVFRYTSVNAGETLSIINTSVRDYRVYVSSSKYDRITYDAAEKISTYAKDETTGQHTLTAGMNVTVTPQCSSLTVVSLWDKFDVRTRRYPALMRQSLLDGEKYSFVNSYNTPFELLISNTKLSYSLYNSEGTMTSSKDEVNINGLIIPEGGYVEFEAKSASVTFFGPYEVFSGEDLTVKVTGIQLTNDTFTLGNEQQALLRANVLPADASNKTIFWESSDVDTLLVVQTGKMIAKRPGTVTVTARTEDGGYTATCLVTILEGTTSTIPVTGISLDKQSITLSIGESDTLSAKVTPSNATNKSVLWTSTNTSVATVTDGVVTAHSAGSATIVAITSDGNHTATCAVTVQSNNEDDGILDSGTDANNIKWTLYKDGRFLVEGNGAMADYATTYEVPWYDNRRIISEVTFDSGITHIGARAFYNAVFIEKINIPASVTSIGAYAFRNCDIATIYGAEGSYVQNYAQKNSIPFVAVKEQLLEMAVETYETDTRKYFEVSLDGYQEDAVVYVAVYDSNNRMVSAKFDTLAKDDITGFSILKSPLCNQVKIFIWKSGQMSPVTNSKTYSL